MTERKTGRLSDIERKQLTALHATTFVKELLIPASEILQSESDITVGDVIEPLFQDFNANEGEDLLGKFDVWRAVQSEIDFVANRGRRGSVPVDSTPFGLESTLLYIQRSVETWLDEHARAEKGDSNRFLSESSGLRGLQEEAARLKKKIGMEKAKVDGYKEKGAREILSREIRVDNWMAENDIQYTQGTHAFINVQQESKGGDND